MQDNGTSHSRVGRATILLVDDDSPIRQIVGLSLKLFGYTVLLAASAEEAIKMARDHPEIRLAILSAIISGLSGNTLAKHLEVSLPESAILFYSGHPAAVLARYDIDVAAGNFLRKPIRPPELRRKIEELLAPVQKASGISASALS